MNKDILDYIKSQRIGVLAVEMPDGSPHGATVHFAHTEDPLVFYFETHKKYKKAEALLGKEEVRATYVIGSDESNMKTLQMDGVASVLKDEEWEVFKKVYIGKFYEKNEKVGSSEVLFFKFVPSWWRFTDWTGPNGKVIISSED